MGLLKSSTYFTVCSTSSIPVSLFDLESRFFAPTHTRVGGRRAQELSRLAVALPWPHAPSFPGPALTAHEHGGHAGCGRDDDQRGALPSGADHRATTLYS